MIDRGGWRTVRGRCVVIHILVPLILLILCNSLPLSETRTPTESNNGDWKGKMILFSRLFQKINQIEKSPPVPPVLLNPRPQNLTIRLNLRTVPAIKRKKVDTQLEKMHVKFDAHFNF